MGLCKVYNDDSACEDLSPHLMKQMASCQPLGVNYDHQRRDTNESDVQY